MKDFEKYYSLWNKKTEFTQDEISFLYSFIKKQHFQVNYGFYNKESSKKKQIAVVFDLEPATLRRSGVENNWEIISSRTITDREIDEYIIHYFTGTFKRFLVFYYKNIERLIYDDKRLNAVTPQIFVDQCVKKGYSGTFQLAINYI